MDRSMTQPEAEELKNPLDILNRNIEAIQEAKARTDGFLFSNKSKAFKIRRDDLVFMAECFGTIADYMKTLRPLLAPVEMADDNLIALADIKYARREYGLLTKISGENLLRFDEAIKFVERALSRKPLDLSADGMPEGMPDNCDGKEQEAWEAFAKSERLDMSQHPLHYLFLNKTTAAARHAWKAAITYCRKEVKGAAQNHINGGE